MLWKRDKQKHCQKIIYKIHFKIVLTLMPGTHGPIQNKTKTKSKQWLSNVLAVLRKTK